jgi:hypothetical protein
MVKKASGSQVFDITPKQGQNMPKPGGKAGAGDRRGTAKLPTTGLLSPQMGPGTRSPTTTTITGPRADAMMNAMLRTAGKQPKRR